MEVRNSLIALFVAGGLALAPYAAEASMPGCNHDSGAVSRATMEADMRASHQDHSVREGHATASTPEIPKGETSHSCEKKHANCPLHKSGKCDMNGSDCSVIKCSTDSEPAGVLFLHGFDYIIVSINLPVDAREGSIHLPPVFVPSQISISPPDRPPAV